MELMEDLQNDPVLRCLFLLDAKVDATAGEGIGVRGTGDVFEDDVPSYFVHSGADLGFTLDETATDLTAVACDVHRGIFGDGLCEGRWRPQT